MKTSSIESDSTLLPRQYDVENLGKNKLLLSGKDSQWDQRLIEQCLGGVLVFTHQIELVYANDGACEILKQLKQEEFSSEDIPEEILHICQALVESKNLFPEQNWLTEFDIFTNAAITLHIRSRWLNPDNLGPACLMLILEDRQQEVANIYLEEASKYGFTCREKEVWLLQQNDHTYKEIAQELGITPNTVKKHMRSIHAKRKAYGGE